MRAPAALVAALCALAWPAASAAPGDVWAKLHRPLHVPRLVAGARCPVSAVNRTVRFDAFGGARGIGAGPAFPIGFVQPGSVLEIAPPASGSNAKAPGAAKRCSGSSRRPIAGRC
jgi:hypothetical protein